MSETKNLKGDVSPLASIDLLDAPTATRYEISSISDFVQVPQARLERCLKEFDIFLRTHLFVKSLSEDLELPPMKFPIFVWIDDDKLEVNIHFKR
jgi:hypothetical protein